MKKFFESLFQSIPKEQSAETSAHFIRLATATLLIEISKADFSQKKSELDQIETLLKQHFSLDQNELESLMSHSHDHSSRLVSLQHLTRELNELMTEQEKIKIIEMMWSVVYADDDKDRFEEYLIRQTADLLYVSHADFIRARLKAEHQ